MLIETFIPGKEYAVEGVLTDGAFQVFTIFDKPDSLDGPFFEETIYVTPSRASAETQKAIVGVIASAIRILGLRHGPVHAECRVNDQGIYVLEVAASSHRGVVFEGHSILYWGLEDLPRSKKYSASRPRRARRHVPPN